MGEVYRARDTRLKRDVAVKVLRDDRAIDADRIARFTREAHALASLNHQNIAAIYGIEDVDGRQALVLELVEGPTLAERVRRGPIPVAEAMAIARQIAEALEAAHEVGIVHRDLKPGNVKLRPDGTVKVLDFGLAKTVDRSADIPAGLTASTTHQGLAISERGMILGTPAYMSPEQARGDPVDKRTDIWAFGCCLYEVLTGKAPFGGPSASDTMAQVLEREPDFAAVKAPPKVVEVLRRCLRKDPSRRLRDIADVRLELEEALAGATDQAPTPPRKRTIAALAALAAVLSLALAAVMLFVRTGDESATRVTRSMIAPPRGGAFFLEAEGPAPAVVSPDGTQLAFGAIDEHGVRRLWVRRLDELNPRALAGTEDARYPFWSPDSRSLGFFTFQELKRIDIEGGRARSLAVVPNGKGGAWNEAGVILFAPATGPLVQIQADGGPTRAVTALEAGGSEDSHRHPRFLPDGRRFFYVARVTQQRHRLMLASLEGGTPQEVTQSESQAEVAGGYLWLIRGGALVALPFDVAQGRVTGEAVLVAETVARIEGAAIGLFSVSPSGVLAYHSDWIPEKTVLAWFNRTGMRVGTLGAPGVHISVELAPNGAAAAVVRTDDVANEDVWVYDIRGDAAPTRLTVDRGNDIEPIWSPDSTRLAFTKGLMQTTIHVHSVTGGRQAALSERDTHSMVTGDWASDGQHIVGFSAIDKGGDLWLLPLEGGTAARPLRQTPFREWQPDITSDGRWIAYSSDESGRQEIWVARFPDGGRKRQVSAAGGSFPEWNAAGNELFYLDENNVVNAVSVKIEGDGLSVSSPKPLFQTRARFGWTDPFAVSPDGQRFLVNTVDVPVAPTPVTVVVGWPSEVAKRRQR